MRLNVSACGWPEASCKAVTSEGADKRGQYLPNSGRPTREFKSALIEQERARCLPITLASKVINSQRLSFDIKIQT
jgi:hypothetical protein